MEVLGLVGAAHQPEHLHLLNWGGVWSDRRTGKPWLASGSACKHVLFQVYFFKEISLRKG